jgi:hypothetical protein
MEGVQMKIMSRSYYTEAQIKYVKNVVGKTCECGNPAIRYSMGSFVCQRCDEIEKAMAFTLYAPRKIHRDDIP